jgi:predicted DNA-binding transcriptional regulator YafY
MIRDDIEKAIDETKVVEFDYYSEKKGASHRIGEPYEIKHTGESDKLYLWDYDRDQIRAFIIDNISNFKLTGETFVPRKAVRT